MASKRVAIGLAKATAGLSIAAMLTSPTEASFHSHLHWQVRQMTYSARFIAEAKEDGETAGMARRRESGRRRHGDARGGSDIAQFGLGSTGSLDDTLEFLARVDESTLAAAQEHMHREIDFWDVGLFSVAIICQGPPGSGSLASQDQYNDLAGLPKRTDVDPDDGIMAVGLFGKWYDLFEPEDLLVELLARLEQVGASQDGSAAAGDGFV